jgi:hypothetical protein
MGADSPADPAADLRKAWDDWIEELQLARDALEDPAYHPAPASDRNLGEGYRYLLGHLHRLIEAEAHQDPDFPYFQRHPWTISKYTIENPDNLYLYAPLDPEGTYRVRGRAVDHAHWRGPRSRAERLAPHYVIFEAHTMSPGDSGGLAELVDGRRAITGMLDSTRLEVEADGSFEVLVAPERPAGYRGNFLPSRAEKSGPLPQGQVTDAPLSARRLFVREVFGDWEREEALELEIVRVGMEGRQPRPRTSADMAAQLRRVGELVRNQVRFWNLFYGVVLDPFGTATEKRPSHLPRNGLIDPAPANLATGGGQATNFFAGGVFELAEDDALLIEVRTAAEPAYTGFHLGNFWGESLDYANHVTSLNHLQAHRDADGALRFVVSHRDPGVPNWLDTTGHPAGYMTLRLTYPEPLASRVVPLRQLRDQLPDATPDVSAEQRRRQVESRQRHVARRYRQY